MAGKIFAHLVHQPVAKAAYRSEIDGLRAIAVLAVMMFHFGAGWMPGGFVGVDVFFVISGYLITRLIRHSLDEGEFSFFEFYVRRARRLFPALFFTLVSVFALGAWIFTPGHLERLGGSALFALLSLGNFFFWAESGYFDASAHVKPLLHFWSLGVEEQFYLFWPAILVFLLARLKNPVALTGCIVISGLASMVVSQAYLGSDPAAAFYLLPFRVFEFAIGAVLVWIPRGKYPTGPIADLVLAAGLVLILFAAVSFSDQTPFPGLNALVPCLGAALGIVAGEAPRVGALLRNRLMVFIGLISYSLYLCHWPIYVFYRYQLAEWQSGLLVISGLTALSIGVATAMYRFVEVPFRFVSPSRRTPQHSARFALACAMLSLVVILPFAHSWAKGGWAWRFGGGADIGQIFAFDRLRHESIVFNEINIAGASFARAGVTRILVVGDSHARDVSNGLHQVLDPGAFEVRMETFDVKCLQFLDEQGQATGLGASKKARACAGQIELFSKSNKVRNADIFVVSMFFSPKTAAQVERLIVLTTKVSGKPAPRIVLMDRTVLFEDFSQSAIRLVADGKSFSAVNQASYRYASKSMLAAVTRTLREKSEGIPGVEIVIKRDLLCGNDQCSFFLDSGELAIWDGTHWTLAGAAEFMSRLTRRRPGLFY